MNDSILPFNPITAIKDANRFRTIVSVLASHGFGQLIYQISKVEGLGKIIGSFGIEPPSQEIEITSLAKRVRMVFQDLGPTFIKLGQILSTRPDLIPPEFVEELKRLQDNVPPFHISEAKNQIETELGKKVVDVFEVFDESPIGTASIGQVYGAKLKTGEEVVVKVQRPDVRLTIESDIDLLYMLAGALEKALPILRIYDLTGIVGEFHQAVRKELDYSNEMRNGRKFGDAFRENRDVVIPKVFREYSTRKILTMERIRGVKITSGEEVGSNKKILAKIAIRAVLTMVFECGSFHADPHPGNIFALPDNRIAFLDLGMVGRLDEIMRFKVADLILALHERDVESVAKHLLTMGIRDGKVNSQIFRRDVADVMDKIMGLPLEEIQFSEILKDLMDGARRNHIRIPSEYTLMGKALLTVEGVGKELDPGLDIESEVSPFIKSLVKERFSPQRISKALFKQMIDLYHWSNDFPAYVMTILDDLQGGNLKVKVEQTDQGDMMKNLERIMGKLTASLIISSLILSSAFFITFSKFDYPVWGIPLTLILGGAGYIAAAFLGLKLIRTVVKSNED